MNAVNNLKHTKRYDFSKKAGECHKTILEIKYKFNDVRLL